MSVWDLHPSVTSEVGQLNRVLVHSPGEEFSTVVDPDAWDWEGLPRQEKAAEEHAEVVSELESRGVTVHNLEKAGENLAESLFVRDAAFTVGGGATIGRMVEETRKGEERHITERLVELGIPIYHSVHGPGGFEAGNMVWIDDETVAVGRSQTANTEGIRQVRNLLDTYNIELLEVPIFGSTESTGQTHLALVFAMVAPDLALVYPEAVPNDFLELLQNRGIEIIEVPMREQRNRATSTIVVEPGDILLPAGNPVIYDELQRRGLDVTEISVREIKKTGGGLKGLILPLDRE